jgi:hypothetical protein
VTIPSEGSEMFWEAIYKDESRLLHSSNQIPFLFPCLFKYGLYGFQPQGLSFLRCSLAGALTGVQCVCSGLCWLEGLDWRDYYITADVRNVAQLSMENVRLKNQVVPRC